MHVEVSHGFPCKGASLATVLQYERLLPEYSFHPNVQDCLLQLYVDYPG